MTSHYTNRFNNLIVSFGCLLLISACSSTESTPGTEVHAHVTHLPPAAANVTETATPGKQFVNDQGVTIELTSAYLTLSEMQIRTDCSVSPFARLLEAVYDLVLPVANAHTESTPTKLGEPLVVNVLNPDTEELEFGHFSPAAGSYCGITVHMHPADADSRGLPTTLSMIGQVLHLEGNYSVGGPQIAFTVETAVEPEHADIAFPATINLSASNLSGEAHLNIEYNNWFDGFDSAAMAALATADSSAVTQLLDNITASISHD